MTEPLEIDAQTLQNWLEEGQPVEVIDIRPRVDYNSWHIPGSINLDAYHHIYAGQPGPLADYQSNGSTPVVAVCFVGQTSQIATSYLRSRGIKAVSLAGGMQSWSTAWNTARLEQTTRADSVVQVRRTGKGCLSYLISSDGEAIVIDASLDPRIYIDLAAAQGWRIAKVADTHIHDDHISRSRILAGITGAEYLLPETERAAFEYRPIRSTDEIAVGNSLLKAIPSPGHSLESICLLLDGEALLTGDTLFLNGVGRPDLMASGQETERRIRLLYASLQYLAGLSPGVTILPGHTEKPVNFDHLMLASTLDSVVENVEAVGYDEERFKAWVLSRIPPPPPNYATIVQLNERGLFPAIGTTALESGANRSAIEN